MLSCYHQYHEYRQHPLSRFLLSIVSFYVSSILSLSLIVSLILIVGIRWWSSHYLFGSSRFRFEFSFILETTLVPVLVFGFDKGFEMHQFSIFSLFSVTFLTYACRITFFNIFTRIRHCIKLSFIHYPPVIIWYCFVNIWMFFHTNVNSVCIFRHGQGGGEPHHGK